MTMKIRKEYRDKRQEIYTVKAVDSAFSSDTSAIFIREKGESYVMTQTQAPESISEGDKIYIEKGEIHKCAPL